MRLLFVSCVCLSLIALGGCGKKSVEGVAIDPALASFVSADTTVLADVKLDALRGTPFYGRHREQLDFPLLKGIGQQLGFDPVHDLSDALVIWNGKDVVVVAKGSFAGDKAEAQLAKSSRAVTYKSARIYGTPASALAFLSGGMLAAGSLHAVEKTIDVKETLSGAVPGGLRKELNTISAASQIRVASSGGLPFADMPMGADAASALSNLAGYVSATSTGINFASGLQINSHISCISEQGAKRVSDALRGTLGMARLSTRGDAMDLLRLWDAIQISQERQSVLLKAELPDDLADQLLTRSLSLGSRRGLPQN